MGSRVSLGTKRSKDSHYKVILVIECTPTSKWKLKLFRDGITQTQDPLISRHPGYNNLVIAGGGSYTRAKDLPTLGKNVLNAISGDPTPDYCWNVVGKSALHSDQPLLLPKGNFKDLEAAAMNDPEVREWRQERESQINIDYLELI
jgi:hypothetical protein